MSNAIGIAGGGLIGRMLGSALARRGWDVRIHGVDVDDRVLREAKAGVYGAAATEGIDAALRERDFTREGDRWRAGHAPRRVRRPIFSPNSPAPRRSPTSRSRARAGRRPPPGCQRKSARSAWLPCSAKSSPIRNRATGRIRRFTRISWCG